MLIVRTHASDEAESEAVYSRCERYRYSLTRIWNARGRKILFVMLNPSTATEIVNDPSVERCERRARAMGFGQFRVCNIFAWRSTDPSALARVGDPVGEHNDQAIIESSEWPDMIVCAWGNHGRLLDRGRTAERMLRRAGRELHHFGITKAGHPRHPLYVGYRVEPMAWR